MTPLFCVDITENRNNDRINGCDTELLVQKTSDLLSSSHDRLLERAETVEGHARMPAFLVLIWYLCGILALLIVLAVVKNLSTLSLARMFLNAPWMFFACPICAVVWLVLTLLARRREKTVLGSEEAARTASRLESSQKAIFDELGIPADAATVDVLLFRYVVRNGQIRPKELAVSASYVVAQMQLFADAERLYLADVGGKCAIPRSSLRAIRTVKKRIRFTGWNKDDRPESKRYKPYKLGTNQYGCVICRWYHILEPELDG